MRFSVAFAIVLLGVAWHAQPVRVVPAIAPSARSAPIAMMATPRNALAFGNFWVVVAEVVGASRQSQVLNSVVSPIVIDMMNDLESGEGSAEVTLHNDAVFQLNTLGDSDEVVPMAVQVPASFPCVVFGAGQSGQSSRDPWVRPALEPVVSAGHRAVFWWFLAQGAKLPSLAPARLTLEGVVGHSA